jgi:hypothetical protein
LLLLARGNVLADGLRRPLHGFGGHLQTGRQFDLPAPVIERGLRAHGRQLAVHARREFRVLDIQVDIGGKLAAMAVAAQGVGTGDFHRAHGGENGPGARLPVVSLMTARTKEWSAGRQPGSQIAAVPSERRLPSDEWPSAPPFRWLPDPDARLASILKDDAQELIYFARHFLADRFGRFFLRRERWCLHGAQSADLFIDIQQLTAEFPETVVFRRPRVAPWPRRLATRMFR